MRDNFNDKNFVKPDAEEYKRNKKAGFNPNKYSSVKKDLAKEKSRLNELDEGSKPSTKDNVIFIVSVVAFLIILIVAKVGYSKMQSNEMKKLSNSKWYVNDEADVKKAGYLELEFKENGTFDMYKSDTQVTCMNGEYSVLYSGKLRLKSDERGFNPPDVWNCKTKSNFKYKFVDNKMEFTYGGETITFYKQGSKNPSEKVYSDETLHKKYFVNKQAKMLVTYYMDYMYLYNLDSVDKVFGDNHEVLGAICLSGMYTLDSDGKKMVVDVNDESEITSNPMWDSMTERKKYEFFYKLEGNGEKLVLQYEDKAYEFENVPINW